GKHTTSGGQGGMVITNDEKLYWNAKRFADRGKPFGSDNPTNLFLGLNYRMTELQAAIGRVQLQKLRSSVRRRLPPKESRWVLITLQ
ncbi:MAG: aminotransferase, partial [Thermoplasmata archaeon]